MTIEERANQKYCDKNGDVIDMANDYKRIGYIQGATEQKAIDIDKACEWLREDLEGALEENLLQRLLFRFSKAMELN